MKLGSEARLILDEMSRRGGATGTFMSRSDIESTLSVAIGDVDAERVRRAAVELLDKGLVVELHDGLELSVKGSRETSKVPSILVGAAGENFVLFQLYRRGIMAGQPPQGVADVDLLVLDHSARVVKNLQVKTRTKGADGGWHLKEKHERLIGDNLWYVFIDMEPEHPVSYIVPSAVVASVVERAHAIWLATPGKNGKPHADTVMRRILPAYPYEVPGFPPGWLEQYREAWDSLRD